AAGPPCSNGWRDCWRKSVDDDQRHRHEPVVVETVSANLHPANRPAKTDNQKYEVSERLLDVGFRWFGIAARMRMVDADDGESLRLRLVDAAAASDLREVVDGRDFVAPRRVVRAVAAGDRFEDGRPSYVGAGFSRPVGAADQ